jgi:phosphoribosyl 1,2-cyclic phosphodiesterase
LSLRLRVLGSGSTGNATVVEGGGVRILVDAGLGPRQLQERLGSAGVDPATIDLVLLSHEHGDHARGAAAFVSKWGMPLAGTRGTWQAAGFGALDLPGYERLEPGETLRRGDLAIRAVAVPHDAAGPVGFVISSGGVSFGHATDLGHLNADLVRAFRGCHAVLLESNFDPSMLRDGPYPWSLKERILGPLGHLSNGEECRQVILAHLSQKNNHPDLALLAAEEALQRGGRAETSITLATAAGTEWVRVHAEAEALVSDAGQLRLF